MTTLDTAAKRKKLDTQGEIAWEEIARGFALGYRAGWWHRRIRKNGCYLKKRFAQADDERQADGKVVLSYREAINSVTAPDEPGTHARANPGSYTVRDAARDYLEWFKTNSKSYDDTKQKIALWILPKLGDRLVSEITVSELVEWHHSIARSKPRARSKTVPRFRKPPEGSDQDEIRRRRKSTANRTLNVLKAMLTHADKVKGLGTARVWRDVSPFRDVDRARVRFLTEAESKRLLNGCESDFRSIVHAALVTGARYGSIRAMRVEDFDPDQGTIYIRKAKTAKSQRHVPLAAEGLALFTRATVGKLGNDFIFTKTNGKPWGRSEQKRRMDAACKTAKIEPAATFHNLKDTFVSHLVKRGVPFAYVSEITGTAVRTLEKYYAHLAQSDVRAVLERNAMKLETRPAKVRRVG